MSIRRIETKLRGRSGYSIAESLIAVLLILLISGGLVTGIQLGAREYRRSMLDSQSNVLCSTLHAIIQNELSNTGEIRIRKKGESYDLVSFFSKNYAQVSDLCAFTALDDRGEPSASGYGQLALGVISPAGTFEGSRLITGGSYTNGMAAAVSVKYSSNSPGGYFTVELTLVDENSDTVLVDTWDVVPLNRLKVNY